MMEVDTVDDKLDEVTPEIIASIKEKSTLSFNDAIDDLCQLEKKYRTAGGDAISIGRILVAIVQLYFESSRLEDLNESVLMFAMKKHLQSEHAIGEMIRECCKFSDLLTDRLQRVKLLETMKTVTNGKLYSEIERAKICKDLAVIKQEDGEVIKAISILEDLRIDTLTTLEKKDHIEIILQLMELLVESKEFIKCLIVAKKINKNNLDSTPDYESLKIKFYRLMITVDQEENYLNTSRHYQAIVSTELMTSQPDERKRLFSLAIVYCVLSPFDHEKSDMMHRMLKHKNIDEVPLYKELLKEFTTIELIYWYTIKAKFKEELGKLGIFDVSNATGLKHWKDFRTATIEHNIKVFAAYYQRAYLSHMSEFLDINVGETEKHLCNLIVNKSIKAKIDRLTGIVSFNQKHFEAGGNQTTVRSQQGDVLEDWLKQITNLMKVIDNTTHLINKEMEL